MIPNQTSARKYLDGFKGNYPPCMIFYGPTGCGQVEIFHEYFDKHLAEADLKSFEKPKVDELLSLTEWVNYQPTQDFRCILVDRVDEISKEASNFLLKIIEDSPAYVRWVLISDSKQLLGPLKSRSFLVPFRAFKPAHGVDEVFGGSLKLKAHLEDVDQDLIQRRLGELVESKQYHAVYDFCLLLKELCDKKEHGMELLRDIYLFSCNTLQGLFSSDLAKLKIIQETKNSLRKNLRGEHTFKAMFLRLL